MKDIILIKLGNKNTYKLILLNYRLNDTNIEFNCRKDLGIKIQLTIKSCTSEYYLEEGLVYDFDETRKEELIEYLIQNSKVVNL